MTLRRSLAIGLVIASLAACTPWARIDQGSRSETRRDDFSLDLPLGWVKRIADGTDFFVTHDGPALNYIVVNRQPHDRKLPGTKRVTRADMLPHELAIAEWKSNEATANLEILSNTPVMLGGKPAARVHIRYPTNADCPSSASWSAWSMPKAGCRSSTRPRRSSISSAGWRISRRWWRAYASSNSTHA